MSRGREQRGLLSVLHYIRVLHPLQKNDEKKSKNELNTGCKSMDNTKNAIVKKEAYVHVTAK
ncbi:hypothetical protein DsansV1_C32g0222511 [Dioscorea sansibarensis]